ncbi:MAG: beta-phosphoglucomutase family hydrolase [Bacteroidota bacterium]
MPIYPFDAVVFDLDGVITQTALIHSHAWKKMFDDYLHIRESRDREPFKEFTHDYDYRTFVDGRPRYEGVATFLKSRGIEIPLGSPEDDPAFETVCGLGNRKNDSFNEVLNSEGVKVYPSTVKLMHELRAAGIRVGVASSSKNCFAVLEAAGLLDLVETRVDGVVSAETGLKGKPEPDIFLIATANLDAIPSRAVVVEDASSGVAAGRKGNFALVLGIAREDNTQELLQYGADVVVEDLEGVGLDQIAQWIQQVKEEDGWTLTNYDYDPKKERTRESQMAIGNGYIGSRAAMEEAEANEVNYPGTYLAGLYNRLSSKVAGKDVENEDFVNCPNWLPFTFRIGDGDWFDSNQDSILSFERKLDFRSGLLKRTLITIDSEKRETLVIAERFASMDNPHLLMQRYTVQPLNYSGKITVKAGLDGAIINGGVERYKSLNQNHLHAIEVRGDESSQSLWVRTTQSGINLALKAYYTFTADNEQKAFEMNQQLTHNSVMGSIEFEAMTGLSYSVVKKVAVYSDKPDDTSNPTEYTQQLANETTDFETCLFQSQDAWQKLWDKMDIKIEGDRLSQKLFRFNLYHLMVSMSPHNEKIDASITARGLHGEAYRGHIFWDELFIIPYYSLSFPEVAKSMLLYRYRRLGKARENAAAVNYRGAMFPWQSGSDGREETQVIHLNPLSGSWDPDHSCLQRHVSLAIAYNVWQYFQITADLAFMNAQGAEMFLEIARFWVSKTHWNEETQRFDITKVMGPDEFHEQYPGSDEGGLNNNAYTNIMVSWMLGLVPELLEILDESGKQLQQRLSLTEEELAHWHNIAHNLMLDISNEGIIAQYQAYFNLKELDWEYYRSKYGNVYRMDRILKSEGLSPDAFKVAKQADTLMTFYNLDAETVRETLTSLNYSLPSDYLNKNLEYYLARTSHGSTLSRLVHARLFAMAGQAEMSWKFFSEALASDFVDIQGGTTGEGIHAGVMGGTIMVALSTFAGLSFCDGKIQLNPALPEAWDEMSFKIKYRGNTYQVVIDKTRKDPVLTVLAMS